MRRFGRKCALLRNARTEPLNILEASTFSVESRCTTSGATVVCSHYRALVANILHQCCGAREDAKKKKILRYNLCGREMYVYMSVCKIR